VDVHRRDPDLLPPFLCSAVAEHPPLRLPAPSVCLSLRGTKSLLFLHSWFSSRHNTLSLTICLFVMSIHPARVFLAIGISCPTVLPRVPALLCPIFPCAVAAALVSALFAVRTELSVPERSHSSIPWHISSAAAPLLSPWERLAFKMREAPRSC
jgi:hypothetical protein